MEWKTREEIPIEERPNSPETIQFG